MERLEDTERRMIAREVLEDLSADEARLAERLAEAFRAEGASGASEGFADRVLARCEKQAVHRSGASRRYEKMLLTESRRWREFARGYSKAITVSAVAAALLLSLSAYWYFKPVVSDRAMVEAALRSADPEMRRAQRQQATAYATNIRDGTANVSGIIADGQVYLVGQRDDVTGELCIFAYQENQWRALDNTLGARGDAALREAWYSVRRRARAAAVHDGRLGIPEDLWADYLDSSQDASVLAFTDRSEFWNPEVLQEYCRGAIKIIPHPDWKKL